MSGDGEVPDRRIVSALEFAVGIAAAGSKLRPPLPFPSELRPFLKFTKLPPKAMSVVRAAVEADRVFLKRLGSVAGPELLDEAGILWLRRPEGWREQLLGMTESDDVDGPSDLRRAERRREAAQAAARRAASELIGVRAELERRADDDAARLIELTSARNERDELRDRAKAQHAEQRRLAARVATLTQRLEQRTAGLAAVERQLSDVERVRDGLLADRANGGRAEVADGAWPNATEMSVAIAAQADRAVAVGHELAAIAGRLAELEPGERPDPVSPPVHPMPDRRGAARRRSSSRRPIAVPGGVYGTSIEAAEFIIRHRDVSVLVDGYNVAKLAWPQLGLEAQRDRCIDACEDVARKHGSGITVVFDGASVVGASAPRRLVRVVFSPTGVSADDVIRAEVAALADSVPVVVITNDQQIVADVRSRGANVVASEQWLALAGR